MVKRCDVGLLCLLLVLCGLLSLCRVCGRCAIALDIVAVVPLFLMLWRSFGTAIVFYWGFRIYSLRFRFLVGFFRQSSLGLRFQVRFLEGTTLLFPLFSGYLDSWSVVASVPPWG